MGGVCPRFFRLAVAVSDFGSWLILVTIFIAAIYLVLTALAGIAAGGFDSLSGSVTYSGPLVPKISKLPIDG